MNMTLTNRGLLRAVFVAFALFLVYRFLARERGCIACELLAKDLPASGWSTPVLLTTSPSTPRVRPPPGPNRAPRSTVP
jgi:hypothetical protein